MFKRILRKQFINYPFLEQSFVLKWTNELSSALYHAESNYKHAIEIPYKFNLFLGSFPLPCYLDIDKIIEFLTDQKAEPVKINKHLFNEYTFISESNDKKYIWYAPSSPNFKDQPIIILETFNSQYWVIDGNHRVSFFKKNELLTVSAYFLNEKALFSNDLFLNESSKIVRKFYQELCNAYDNS